ncbi:hypothetical protein Tco_0407669 [Tanacetum coccineum]
MFGLKLKPCGLTNLVGTIVFGKLSAINGFVDSLPVAVCSRIANSFLPFRHGELITIFGAVVKPSLDELSALWLSYSWICDALAVRQGDSSFSVLMLLGLVKALSLQTLRNSFPFDSYTMGQRPWVRGHGLATLGWFSQLLSQWVGFRDGNQTQLTSFPE